MAWTHSDEGLQTVRIDQQVGGLGGLDTLRTTATAYNPDSTVASEISTEPGKAKARCNYAANAAPASGHDADGHPLVVRTVTGADCAAGTQLAAQTLTWDEGGTLATDTQSVRSPQLPNSTITRTQSFTFRADRTLTQFVHDGVATTSRRRRPGGSPA